MIANRLTDFELEIHIEDEVAPARLKSARLSYAPNCVHVVQDGSDVLCRAEEDYIRILNIELNQAFNIIQYIFDFYDDWSMLIFEAGRQHDYQRVIDESWFVFRNPLVLLDANHQVLAISSQVGAEEVDSEWHHLKTFGYSSVEAINFMLKNCPQLDFWDTKPQLYHFTQPFMNADILSVPIFCENNNSARLNIYEKSKELNYGDHQLLEYLANRLSPFLGEGRGMRSNAILLELLENPSLNAASVQPLLRYRNWDVNGSFGVWVLKPEKEIHPDAITLYTRMVMRWIPELENFVYDFKDHVVLVFNYTQVDAAVLTQRLLKLKNQTRYIIGQSLPAQGILNIFYGHQQALSAIEWAGRLKKCSPVCDFYHFAIEYMLQCSDTQALIHACHPGIRNLWDKDEADGGEKITTLSQYLDCERSLNHTAGALYVHRNTLLYRLKKIFEILQADLDDAYTRDYVKLSLRIMYLIYAY